MRAVTAHGTAVRAVANVTTVHTVAAAGGRAAIGAMGRSDATGRDRPWPHFHGPNKNRHSVQEFMSWREVNYHQAFLHADF